MKRIFSIALVILMTAVLFVGCSGHSIEGTYKLKAINDQNLRDFFNEVAAHTGINFETLMQSMNATGDTLSDMMSLSLNADGSATLNSKLTTEESKTGTWKQEGDKIVINVDGETVEFTRKGSELTGSSNNMRVTLSK